MGWMPKQKKATLYWKIKFLLAIEVILLFSILAIMAAIFKMFI